MKRALSLFLAAIMVLTVIPFSLPVVAEEPTEQNGLSVKPITPDVPVLVNSADVSNVPTDDDVNGIIEGARSNGVVYLVATDFDVSLLGDVSTATSLSGAYELLGANGGEIIICGNFNITTELKALSDYDESNPIYAYTGETNSEGVTEVVDYCGIFFSPKTTIGTVVISSFDENSFIVTEKSTVGYSELGTHFCFNSRTVLNGINIKGAQSVIYGSFFDIYVLNMNACEYSPLVVGGLNNRFEVTNYDKLTKADGEEKIFSEAPYRSHGDFTNDTDKDFTVYIKNSVVDGVFGYARNFADFNFVDKNCNIFLDQTTASSVAAVSDAKPSTRSYVGNINIHAYNNSTVSGNLCGLYNSHKITAKTINLYGYNEFTASVRGIYAIRQCTNCETDDINLYYFNNKKATSKLSAFCAVLQSKTITTDNINVSVYDNLADTSACQIANLYGFGQPSSNTTSNCSAKDITIEIFDTVIDNLYYCTDPSNGASTSSGTVIGDVSCTLYNCTTAYLLATKNGHVKAGNLYLLVYGGTNKYTISGGALNGNCEFDSIKVDLVDVKQSTMSYNTTNNRGVYLVSHKGNSVINGDATLNVFGNSELFAIYSASNGNPTVKGDVTINAISGSCYAIMGGLFGTDSSTTKEVFTADNITINIWDIVFNGSPASLSAADTKIVGLAGRAANTKLYAKHGVVNAFDSFTGSLKGVVGGSRSGSAAIDFVDINLYGGNYEYVFGSGLASNGADTTTNVDAVGKSRILIDGDVTVSQYMASGYNAGAISNTLTETVIKKCKNITKMYIGSAVAAAAISTRCNIILHDITNVKLITVAQTLGDAFIYYANNIDLATVQGKINITKKTVNWASTSNVTDIRYESVGDKTNHGSDIMVGEIIAHAADEDRLHFKAIADQSAENTVFVNNSTPLNTNNDGITAPVYDLLDAMYILGENGGNIVLETDIKIGDTYNWGKVPATNSTLGERVGFVEPKHSGKYVISSAEGTDSALILPTDGYVYSNTVEENKTEFAFLNDNDYITDTYSIYDKGEGKVGVRLNGEIKIADVDNESFPIVEFGTLIVPADLKNGEVLYHLGACGYDLNTQGDAVDKNTVSGVVKFVHYVSGTDIINYVYKTGDENATFYSALFGAENGGFAEADLTFRTYAVVLLPDGTTTVVYGEEVTKSYNGIYSAIVEE